MHDLVIRGGTIVDGSGASAYTGDVAIDGGLIAALSPKGGGKVGAGKREVDADGLLVTPGFVDIHTHYDAQVTWDPYLTPSSWHGCTTVVMGSCGVGFAPAAPDKHEWLIRLMEGVEDIPGAALVEGIQWDWESFPEYLDAIERSPHAIDFGAQMPHGAVRGYVMGERGADNEEATAADIAAMSRIVEEGIRAGGLGFSTSRTLLHKSIDGRPVPGTFAAQNELMAIGKALGRAGHGVFQFATEHTNVPGEIDFMKVLSMETGRRVMFNLSQIDQAPDLWREGLRQLESAVAAGADLKAQVAGRAIGIVMNLQGTAHPFALIPSWMQVMSAPWEERLALLRDPAFKQKLLTEEGVRMGDFEDFVTKTFAKMFPLTTDYEPSAEDSIGALAARTGKSPRELAYEMLMGPEQDGQGSLYFPLFNYSGQNLDVLHELHGHKDTILGLSDAGAHCGAICDGGMPTFMLTHWARDRQRGPRFDLEYVVHRQTQQTAEAFGLFDRGLLKPGYKADVNLIDYEALSFERPKLVWDLPAGGRRLLQRASGYEATICSGEIIAQGGEATGAMPGALVRGPQGLKS